MLNCSFKTPLTIMTNVTQTDVQTTHLVAGDLVQRSRPSVGNHVILLDGRTCCYVVLRPLTWTGVGQLNERQRGAADGGHGLQEETKKQSEPCCQDKIKTFFELEAQS